MRAMPAVLVVVVLAVFAWHPAGLPQAFAQQDKLVHLLGFAAFALTLRLGLPALSRPEYAGVLLLAASALELGQTFLPTRTASLGDLVADGIGAVLGFALADAWRQWRSSMTAVPAEVAFPRTAGTECQRHDGSINAVHSGDRR